MIFALNPTGEAVHQSVEPNEMPGLLINCSPAATA